MTQSELFSRQSQKNAIGKYLQSGGTVTSLKAVSLFGCLRLSERIRELQAEGFQIKHERIKVGNKHVVEYSIPTEKETK